MLIMRMFACMFPKLLKVIIDKKFLLKEWKLGKMELSYNVNLVTDNQNAKN